MSILLSEIVRYRAINRYNNCSLPHGSVVEEIKYPHSLSPKIYGNIKDVEKCCTTKYIYYKENNNFILYKRRGKNEYHIYFKK